MANDNWNSVLNWQGGAVPTTAAPVDLVFNNSASFFTSNNNINGLVVDSLAISSGTYTITGNQFTLGNSGARTISMIIVNNGASMTINNPIQLGGGVASTEFISVQAGGSLTVNGQLTGTSAAQLTKQGGGVLTLEPPTTIRRRPTIHWV